MSDEGAEHNGMENGQLDENICRDFLRNVCKRGKRCKYNHPSDMKSEESSVTYEFCHDYQNTGCNRPNCKFLHCTREEEESYKATGHLPSEVQRAASLGIGANSNDVAIQRGEVPVCKDFLKGDCRRGQKCKFRHVSNDFNDRGRSSNNSYQDRDRERGLVPLGYDFPDRMERDRYRAPRDRFGYDDPIPLKRRREDIELDIMRMAKPASHSSISYDILEEENSILRRKVDDLKKQVSDLAATNEVLLEQNARYRLNSLAGMPGLRNNYARS